MPTHNQLPILTGEIQKQLALSTLNEVFAEFCRRIDRNMVPSWWSGLQINARLLDIFREKFGQARVEMGRYQQMKQAQELKAGLG